MKSLCELSSGVSTKNFSILHCEIIQDLLIYTDMCDFITSNLTCDLSFCAIIDFSYRSANLFLFDC